MSEASYTAWDDNLYAWPPPDGWYQATDGRWWPSGYGPAVSQPAAVDDGPASAAPGTTAGPFDPERTSALPAGGLAPVVSAFGPAERNEAEGRRRVFEELPPIDDVFGGIDPYADDEAVAPSSPPPSPGGPPPSPAPDGALPSPGGPLPSPGGPLSSPGGPLSSPDGALPLPGGSVPGSPLGFFEPVGSDGPDLGGPNHGSGSGTGFDVPTGNGVAGGSPGPGPDTPTPFGGAKSVENGSAPPAPAFDAGATRFAPPTPPPPPDGPPDDDPTGPMADGGPDRDGALSRDPVEEWATATTVLPSDDGGATTQLDLNALQEAGRAIEADRDGRQRPGAPAGRDDLGHWGGVPDWASGADRDLDLRRDHEPGGGRSAVSGTGALHRDSGGLVGDDPLAPPTGFGDLPITAAPTPRRWWPLVAIGLAVLVAAGSIVGYLALRDDTGGAVGTNGPDAAGGPGSFASPYPFAKVVVVYYNDKATGEQRRWVIQVLTPVADATRQLVDDGTAAAPADGDVLALTRVRITYQSGPEPGSLSDLRFQAAGAAADTVFDDAAACPAAQPLDPAAQLNVLESAEGDLCWRIPAGELSTLKLAVQAEAAAGTVHLVLNGPAGG